MERRDLFALPCCSIEDAAGVDDRTPSDREVPLSIARPLEALHAYLAFGWVPAIDGHGRALLQLIEEQVGTERTALTAEALRDLWLDVLGEQLRATPDARPHCVLLSAGLDSQAILVGLLHHLGPQQVFTATYGVPGGREVSDAAALARALGVRHHVFDVRQVPWSEDEVVRYLHQGGSVVGALRAGLFCWRIHEHFGDHVRYWSGFLGGASTGAHTLDRQSPTWAEALDRFAPWNCVSSSVPLLPDGVEPRGLLPREPFADPRILSYDDQLDLLLRQQRRIRNGTLFEGYDIAAPFTDDAWLRGALRLPREQRLRQALYREMLAVLSPELLSGRAFRGRGSTAPTSSHGGARRLLPARLSSRLRSARRKVRARRQVPVGRIPAYGEALRRDSPLQRLVSSNLADLERRGVVPWIDVPALWDAHARGAADHWKPLLHLASVELKLKSLDRLR